MRWTVPGDETELDPQFARELGQLGTGNLLSRPGSTLLKERATKEVVALSLAGREVVIKRTRSGRRRTHNEWNLLVEAHGLGVTVPEPIALGEQADSVWIIQERVPSHGDIETLFRRPPVSFQQLLTGPTVRHDIAQTLGKALRTWHDSGLEHTDLHAGNLLLSGTPGNWTPTLIDLDGAQILGIPLPEKKRLTNLAVLNRFFFRITPRSERLRFLRAYLDSDVSEEKIRSWARQIERGAYSGARRLWSRRRPWCYRENRRFSTLRCEDLTGFLDREFRDWGFLDRLETLDEWMDSEDVTAVLKDSRSARVVRLADPKTGKELVLKRSNFRPKKTAGALFQDSKAMRAWRGAWALRQRQVPIARPLAVLERRRTGLLVNAYVVTLAVPNALGLDHDLARRCNDRQELICATARLVRDLHVNLGLAHGDLKPANILVSRDDSDAPTLVPIDLEGIAREKKATRDRRVTDLSRLARSFLRKRSVSRTEFLRFLLTYLGPGPVDREAWKLWWQRVARATLP